MFRPAALLLCLSIAARVGALAAESAARVSRGTMQPIPVTVVPSTPQAFGGEVQEKVIGGPEFFPSTSYEYVSSYGAGIQPAVDGQQVWTAPLGLPSGAVLEEIGLLVRDLDPGTDIQGKLIFASHAVEGPGDCNGVYSIAPWDGSSAGLDGFGVVHMAAPTPLTLRNREVLPCAVENYLVWMIDVELQSTNHSFDGAVVRWRRSVSPAPPVATFNDVPTDHPFFQFVEALAASGITAGCGGGNYCPESPLTRGQMAVFLAKALGLHWPN